MKVLSSVMSVLALVQAASAEDAMQRDLVAVSDAEPCPNDYELVSMVGDTVPAQPPIEILEQNGDTVKFKVNQVWTPFGADHIFVEYKSDQLGQNDCVEYESVGELDDIILTARCMHTQPITIVEVFVVDSGVQGDATIPECCHSGAPPDDETVKYVFELQCTPTCPDPNDTPDCPEVFFDFNDLPEYSYVHDEYWYTYGFKITAQAKTDDIDKRHTPLPKPEFPIGSAWEDRYGFTENDPNDRQDDVWDLSLHNQAGGAARVFNTQKPDGYRGNPKCDRRDPNDGDMDLGSPNKDCPAGTPGMLSNGPGIGKGGKDPGSSHGWPNCPSELLGNVIIIQEKAKSCPDDTSRGGWITFDFNPNIAGDVEFTFAKVLDTDEGITPKIKVWKTNENVNNDPSVPVFVTAKTGENGLYYKSFSTDSTWKNRYKNIKRIQFEYAGSGSVAEIGYKPSKCPPTP